MSNFRGCISGRESIFRVKCIRISAAFLLTITALLLSGCQLLVSRVSSDLAENLSVAILNSEDPKIVEDGVPAYLILVDALLLQNDFNADLMLVASQLNGSYAAAFVSDLERRKSLTQKARDLAIDGACLKDKTFCDFASMTFSDMKSAIEHFGVQKVPVLYSLASAWAGWLDAHSDDMKAVVELPKVRLLIERILQLDETYDNGAPHMYMGVFESLTPPSLGGRPEVARRHFLKAIEISDNRNLFAKVLYAQNYARMMYDRELHDALLNEVLDADPRLAGYTLQNTIAQRMAKELKNSADEYF